MQNRELKSIVATVVGSLCLAAAAYAATAGTASGSSNASTPSAATPATSGTPGQTSTVPGTPGSPAPGAATTTPDMGAASAKYTDGDIVALVLTVDENEIKAAQAAEKKKMGKDAMKFAKMLLKQHREDSNKVSKIAKKEKIMANESNAKAQELRGKGESDLQALSAKDSLEFEQGYVAAMVQGHTDVLALMDEHLIKDVENKKLKNQLEETRKHVAHHLEEAKRLQSDRASR